MKAPAFWNRLKARYTAMSLRERRIVAAAVVIGPLLILHTLLVDPATKRLKTLRTGLAAAQQQADDLGRQEVILDAQLKLDPDANSREELARLQQALGGAGERIAKLQQSLVPPKEMNAMLERILARHPNLQLISLKTLPPESIFPAPKPETKEAGTAAVAPSARVFDLYRHGMELRLEGGYADLHGYLTQLEREQKKLLWGRLRFEVLKYPTAAMTLTVYTLSSDKTWLAM